jgi:thiol-disulfide isomerase/thioredoxin
MKKLASILTIMAVLLFTSYTAKAQCEDHSDTKHTKSECSTANAKVAAIKFHADYCGACKKLEPKISELKAAYKDKAVAFIVFDFTDNASKEKTQKMAKAEGLETVLNAYKGTGFIVLYDLENKKVIGKLKNSQNINEMEAKINAYL